MRSFFVTLFLMVLTLSAEAGSQTGSVTFMTARSSDGLHWFALSGTPANRPACATGPYFMIKDENSIAGKTQISMVLAAYAAGKTISVKGAGTCLRWMDGEDVDWLTVQ